MKSVRKILLAFVLFFLLHTSYFLLPSRYENKLPFTFNSYAAGCTFTVSPTTIAPHGSFTVTVSNTTSGTEYIIAYDSSFFVTTWISNGSPFSVTVSVDQIFGANDPRASNGTFLVTSGSTHALGHPGAEQCSPTDGIPVTVDSSLYATPYDTPYDTPYGYPTPYETPYDYPAPYGYPTPPYDYPTPYETPYITPPYDTPPYDTPPYVSPPEYGTPYGSPSEHQIPPPEGISRQGGINCPVGAASFNIRDCFHPARIAGYDQSEGFGRLASDIILILTSVAASLSLIFIVISGIKFVTSGGDPKNLAGARLTLTYAIIGIVVTILAFVILTVVQVFLNAGVEHV